MRSFLSFSCSLAIAFVLHVTPAQTQNVIRISSALGTSIVQAELERPGYNCIDGVRSGDTLTLTGVAYQDTPCSGAGAAVLKNTSLAGMPIGLPCAPSLREMLLFTSTKDLVRAFVCPGQGFSLLARPGITVIAPPGHLRPSAPAVPRGTPGTVT